jgi:translation initiation factor 2B subunit (eIF-2B alpha/beta/delta family)
MPCDTVFQKQKGQTKPQREAQVKEALRRLEEQLRGGRVTAVVGPNGALAFKGWRDRDGLSDACAYRLLASKNSADLRRAVARAEVQSGKRVNERAISAGWHSHDDGETWGRD